MKGKTRRKRSAKPNNLTVKRNTLTVRAIRVNSPATFGQVNFTVPVSTDCRYLFAVEKP